MKPIPPNGRTSSALRRSTEHRADRFPRSIASALIALTMTIGCAHNQDIPLGAIPQRAGNHVCAWQSRQIEKANLDRLVFYDRDWKIDTAELKPHARRRLDLLLANQSWMMHPFIVAQSADGQLDEDRRVAMETMLAERGIQPNGSVIVGAPIAEGLHGLEAPFVSGQLFNGANSRSGNATTAGRANGLSQASGLAF